MNQIDRTTDNGNSQAGHHKPEFSFVMIVLNGMPLIEYSLKSIYDFAHEIVIVEGAVENCMFAANPDGSSTDGTVDFLKSFPDPAGKIKLIQGMWPEKCEMQNEALRYVTGDYVWLIDSDEAYKTEDLARVRDMIIGDPDITQVNFIPDNFWKGLDHIFVSSQFSEPSHHYRRLFKFRPGSVFTTHRPPTMMWPGERHSTEEINLIDGHTTRRMGITMYHYSYVLDSQVKQKIELYRRYGWDKGWATDLIEWYEQCYQKWTPENSREIEKSYGVWAADKTSRTVRFMGRHPDAMRGFKGAENAQTVPVETGEPAAKGFKIAAEHVATGMAVETESAFGAGIKELFAQIRPQKLIETGTYMGTGTTTVIAEALRDLKIDASFYTIEVNPEYHEIAVNNLLKKELKVCPLNGLSVPRAMLPRPEDVHAATVATSDQNIFVDHDASKRVELYMAETHFDVQDDLLYWCLKTFDFKPDFVLLDSAGHMGNIEFNYLISQLRGPCHIALDDIHHVKHSKSLQQIKSDPRFELLVESPEKFGFCIARFTPQDLPAATIAQPQYDPLAAGSVLIVRPDSIGDFVIFSGVLEHVRAIYPNAKISILVQKMVAPLAQVCPHIDDVIPFDRKAFECDAKKCDEFRNALYERRFDVAIYPLYSREHYWDQFTLGIRAKTTITIDGGDSNQPQYKQKANDLFYDIILPARKEQMLETARNDEFIHGLSGGQIVSNSMPLIWLSPVNHDAAGAILDQLQIDDFIAICPFAQAAARQWPAHKWVQLLRHYHNYNILICGPESDSDQACELMALSDHPRMFNCCGKTSLLDMAALIKRARLCIAMESAPAHLAATVDTPHVVIVGGGHFGRFMPYSPMTHIVAKKMACFNCNWKCERWFWNADCITAVEVADVKDAVDNILGIGSAAAEKPDKYLVSAIISTYNSGDSILGCIEDLEQQTIADKLEIIVVNSNSPANEEEIVLQLQQKYSNIKYLRTPKRETLYKAWNRAIKMASGKYITNANCDDRHRPDALEVLANALEADSDKAVAYADQQFVNDIGGQPIRRFDAGKFDRFRLMSQWCFISSHPMWRRSIHKEMGYFDPQFFICGDYEFWLRVSQRHGFVYINEVLGDRVWNEQCLSTVEYHKKDGLCFLEDRIIRLAYHRAWQDSFLIDRRGISANPLFKSQPDVRLWKRRIRSKVKGLQFGLQSNIQAISDTHSAIAPSLSIVVETAGDGTALQRCLTSLAQQTSRDFEVVLIDRTVGGVCASPQTYPVRYISFKEDWGAPAARNIGIDLARGRLVAFLDEKCTVHPDFAGNIIARLSQQGSVGLRARVLSPHDGKTAWVPQRFDLGDQSVICMAQDEPCAFTKEALLQVDGFDTTLVGSDIPELCYRIYKASGDDISAIMYYPDIIAYQEYCADAEDHRRRQFESSIGWKYAVSKDAAIQNYADFFQSLMPSNRKSLERDFHKLMNIVLMLKKSHPAEAVEWARKAMAVKPDDISCRYSLASLLIGTGSQEARPLLESLVIPLLQLVNTGHSKLLNYHPGELENTAACLISVCTKLAQCYMADKALGKVKTIYSLILQNTAIILSQEQEQAFRMILARLQNVPAEPIGGDDVRADAAVAAPLPSRTAAATPPHRYLVSAIVSTYNSEEFMRGCLEDLERQTIAGKLEIIVINSGSEQNEEAIVHEFQSKYDNIQYIRTQRESIYAAWNRAVKVAKGKYLTNANTDDRHKADAFELMAQALDAEPKAALVWADQIKTDTPNAPLEDCHQIGQWKWEDYTHRRLKLGCCVGSQPMWRASVHSEVGYFDETLTCAGDWDMWLRIAEKHSLKHIPEFLGSYYHNDSGIEHGSPTHSLYERYVVGKRYGTPYISVIPFVDGPQYPLVSILMAAHNDQKYIAEAIESVLIQNYRRFELVVVNDGSTDSTGDIIAGFKDERLRCVNKPNGGLSSARNAGIHSSTGRFIVLVDADDVLAHDYVLEHMKAFQANPTAALVYCDHQLIDEQGRPLRELKQFEYSDQATLVRDMFRCGYPVIQPRGMLSRTAFDTIGLFDESFLTGEDYELMTRFVKAALRAVRLPLSLYKRRMRSGSLSRDGDPAKTPFHFAAIDRLVNTFDHTQLFPDVDWSAVPSDKVAATAKCLIGATLFAMAQNYHAAKKPTSAMQALTRATANLRQSASAGFENAKSRQLLRDCEIFRRQVLLQSDNEESSQTTQEPAASNDNYSDGSFEQLNKARSI